MQYIRNLGRYLVALLPLKLASITIGETRQLPLLRTTFITLKIILNGDFSVVSPKNATILKKNEFKMSKYLNVRHAYFATNGGTALQLALRALGLEPGSKVLIQNGTCAAAYQSILGAGCIPVLVSMDEQTLGFDLQDFKVKFRSDIKCVVITHLGGIREDIKAVMDVVDGRAPTLEDSCLYFAPYYSEPLTDIQVFSFGFSKPISSGEGALITTNKDVIAEKIARLRNWGKYPEESDEFATVPAWNSRPFLLSAIYASQQIKSYRFNLAKLQVNTRNLKLMITSDEISVLNPSVPLEDISSTTLIFRGMDLHNYENLMASFRKAGVQVGNPVYLSAFKIPFMSKYLTPEKDVTSQLEFKDSHFVNIGKRYMNSSYYRRKILRILASYKL